MVPGITREKYMNKSEVKQLREWAQAKALLDEKRGRVQGTRMWMLLDFALQTGLRVQEIKLVQLKHYEKRGLWVNRLKKKEKDKKLELLVIGKELRQHLDEFIKTKPLRDEPIDPEAYLFMGKRGPLTKRGLQQMFKVAVKKAGLSPDLSIHACRHTLACTLLKKTSNLRMVQKMLSHKDPETTANLYADISYEDMEENLNGLYEDEENNK